MKKGILAALLVAVLGWAGATWYTGGQVQAHAQTLVQHSNELLAKQSIPGLFTLRLEPRGYTRGLLSSRARYALVFATDSTLPRQMRLPSGEIELETRIDHGPFPAGALARGIFMPQMAHFHSELAKTDLTRPLFDLTRGAAPLVSEQTLGYGGSIQIRAHVPPFDYRDGASTSLKFSGLEYAGVARLGQSTRGKGHIASISLQTNGGTLEMADIRMEDDSTRVESGLFVGKGHVSAARIEIATARSPQVALKDLAVRVQAGHSGSAMDYAIAYELGALELGGVALGGGAMVLKAGNLEPQALLDFTRAYERLMRSVMTQKQQAVTQEAPALLAAVGKLLAGKPTVALDPLRWQTAQGQSQLTLKFTLAPLPGLAMLLKNPQAFSGAEWLLEAIGRIDAQLRVSRPMLEHILRQAAIQQGQSTQQAAASAQEQVSAVESMALMLNLMESQGDELVGNFEYANGSARLNGNEVPLQDLLEQLSTLR